MPIRFATLDDVPALAEGGRRIHALTRLRRLDYDEHKVRRTLVDLIARGTHKYALFVAEGEAGRVVGALLGVLEQHIFSDRLTASVVVFGVLPEARMGGHAVRLLRVFERWAGNRNVAEISFGINSGEDTERLARFARRMGYGDAGGNFVKDAV